MTYNPEDVELDLDQLTIDELSELAHMPEIVTTAQVLREWLHRMHGITASDHGVGLFLDLLASEGYRVTPIEAPDFELPAPTK